MPEREALRHLYFGGNRPQPYNSGTKSEVHVSLTASQRFTKREAHASYTGVAAPNRITAAPSERLRPHVHGGNSPDRITAVTINSDNAPGLQLHVRWGNSPKPQPHITVVNKHYIWLPNKRPTPHVRGGNRIPHIKVACLT